MEAYLSALSSPLSCRNPNNRQEFVIMWASEIFSPRGEIGFDGLMGFLVDTNSTDGAT